MTLRVGDVGAEPTVLFAGCRNARRPGIPVKGVSDEDDRVGGLRARRGRNADLDRRLLLGGVDERPEDRGEGGGDHECGLSGVLDNVVGHVAPGVINR